MEDLFTQMFGKNQPLPEVIDPERIFNQLKPHEQRMTFIHPDNNDRIKHFEVYGGGLYNCGEDAMSRIADKNHEILETVIYCPSKCKGGGLCRPKYYTCVSNSRSIVVEFPKLVLLVMNLYLISDDDGLWSHLEASWSTPSLIRLVYRVDTEDKIPTDFIPFGRMFEKHVYLKEIWFVVYSLKDPYVRLDLVKPTRVLNRGIV